MSRGKRTKIFLWIVLLTVRLFPVNATSNPFPLGLELIFHISDDINGEWDERFKILRWAPEVSETTLLMNFSSTREDVQTHLLYMDISTWLQVNNNGSVTNQPLLWANVSEWHPGATVRLTPSSNAFHLSTEYISISLGTFPCWQARSVAWFSVDDDYQLSSENWYFHHSQGLLVKQTSEFLASQHGIYTHRYTRELIASNFAHYGVLSVEEQSQLLLQSLGITLAVVLVIMTSSVIGFKKYGREQCR